MEYQLEQNPIDPADYASNRYAFICGELGLPKDRRPALEVLSAAKAAKMQIHGEYLAGPHSIRLSAASPELDYTIVHELVHAVCRKEMKYLGSHAVPYVALHDLVMAYYFPNQGRGDGDVVESQWSKIACNSAKASTKSEAADIVKAIYASLGAIESIQRRPSILELAARVSLSPASKYCFNWRHNVKALFRLADKTWTQKRAVYHIVGKCLAWLSIAAIVASIGLFQLSSQYHWAWPQKPALILLVTGIGALCSLPVYLWCIKKFAGYDPGDFKKDAK
ncbi:hypothetical protein [Janthinobacterium fluminis]|uniref:SprT-like family protein n=1 Tax=Janthinobacterium fluminis TaxID=2987524 RepID=A0ABT5K493_9BURK|nr:hypothetical protein [Janthinobacterium fluminis]MDC8758921.1 hypothetical protein [Janthinobacterium fluminis]